MIFAAPLLAFCRRFPLAAVVSFTTDQLMAIGASAVYSTMSSALPVALDTITTIAAEVVVPPVLSVAFAVSV